MLASTTTRTLLATIGGTAIYLQNSRDDWLGPFDAFTIPVGASGQAGDFARDYLSYLGDIAHVVNQHLDQISAITLNAPLLIEVPRASHYLPGLVYIATSEKESIHSPTYSGEASVAICFDAMDRGSNIALTVMGAGDVGLSTEETIRAIFEALAAELPYRIHSLMEITITSAFDIDPQEISSGHNLDLLEIIDGGRNSMGPLSEVFDKEAGGSEMIGTTYDS